MKAELKNRVDYGGEWLQSERDGGRCAHKEYTAYGLVVLENLGNRITPGFGPMKLDASRLGAGLVPPDR